MKKFNEFSVGFIPFNSDLVSGVLWGLDIAGILESDPFLKVFAEADKNIGLDSIESILESLHSQNLIERYSVSAVEIEDKNWNELWESQIGIIEIGDSFVIKPTFKKYDGPSGKIIIELDPKMSFGTGEHPTTKMMLELLEKYPPQAAKVLDVGSGTAVLTIAALKLGADSAIAVDNDEWCSLNGEENARINDCTESISLRLGTIDEIKEKDFDLILANINRNILVEIAKMISQKTKTGGKVFLSGFLENDEQIIRDAFLPQSLEISDKIQIGEWIALVLTKLL